MTNAAQTGGWDYSYVTGNFLIIDVNFWYQPIVGIYITSYQTLDAAYATPSLKCVVPLTCGIVANIG